MAVTSAEARARIEGDLAGAIEELALVAASLGDAYERLDSASADALEAELYRPAQRAYGRAKREYARFGERYGLATRELAAAPDAAGGHDAKALIARAVAAAGEADHRLASIQDSEMAIEVGDAELRAALAEVRELVAPLPRRARELVRRLGR